MTDSNALKIEVLYSCHSCGLNDVKVQVPARTEENVLVWMETTGAYLSADHDKRSPHCHPDTLSNVKIPITGTDRIGGAPVQ